MLVCQCRNQIQPALPSSQRANLVTLEVAPEIYMSTEAKAGRLLRHLDARSVTLTSMTTVEPPIRVFLSYAQADDLVLEFIEPFVTSLKHMTFADQGRQLEVFIDRQSIGWGDDWQAAIRRGIDSATVFMPVVTRQYFDRPACREELLTFYSEAKALGVANLLLPVVLLGHSYISADSQDVASRIISERQYRDLKEAWITGSRSAIWRTAIVQLANELVTAAVAAERSLAVITMPHDAPHLIDDSDDSPGAAEVGVALEEFGEKSQVLLLSLGEVLTEIPDVLPAGKRLQEMQPAAARNTMLEVAARLRPLGVKFQEQGREFETVAMKTDEVMRGYVRYLREHQMDDVLETERAAMVGTEEAMAPVMEAEGFVADFLDQIRPMEILSAPMRNSLRGFREGGKAIRGAITIMRGWPRILDES